MDGSTSSTKTKNVVERMIDVMKEVGSIGKDRASPDLKYKFRGIDDITPVVQPLFVKHGVVLTMRVIDREREVVHTSSGKPMFSVRLLVEHTFRAPDGSTVVTSSFGEAMDNMDKASNKAMTAALKATLTTSFTIPVNDPEADTEASAPVELAGKTEAPRPQPKPTSAPATRTAQQATQQPRPASKPTGNGPTTLPNYGRSKGLPIAGAAVAELEFYANGARRSLADPSKSRFHEKEQALLDALTAEIQRQSGGVNGRAGDDRQSDGSRPGEDDQNEPPPPGDEDAPF